MIAAIRMYLVAFLATVLGALVASPIWAAPGIPTPIYTYDTLAHPAPSDNEALERGPPAAHDLNLANDAGALWSRGASARSDEPVPPAAMDYDHPDVLVPVARTTGTTEAPAEVIGGEFSALKRAGVAANAGTSRLWNPVQVGGRRVYQRDDLIDPLRTNARGETSSSLMQRGRAPIGPDGQPIQLHHLTQREPGSIAEVTQLFHSRNSSVLHINPNTIPSGIDRAAFNRYKSGYWMQRAGDFG